MILRRRYQFGAFLLFCLFPVACPFVVPGGTVPFYLAPSTFSSVSHSLEPANPFSLPSHSVVVSVADDIPLEAAFQDSISFADSTIQTMGIAFGVAVLLLVGLKAASNQMDKAIQQVLIDFEATCKRYHPQRWSEIEQELQGLVGDERDVNLLKIMERIQEKEPEFMAKLKEKMKSSSSLW